MKYPLELFFSLTTKCNLKCKHCYSNSGDCGKRIDYDFILNLMKEIRPLRMVISGGDPMMEKDFLIKLLKEYESFNGKNTFVVLPTNGTLLTKENLEEIKPYVDRLQISLDTLDKNKFMGLRGVDLLKETIAGIKLAVSENFDVQIAFVLFENNLDEIGDIFNFCVENKIKRLNVLRQRPLGRSVPNVSLHKVKESYEKFLELSKNSDVKIIIHDPLIGILDGYDECPAAKDVLAVDVEGNFKPCPLFEKSIKGEFEDVWKNDDFFNEVREGIKECSRCSVAGCKGGCKACSWNLKKKAGKDPWCFKN